MTGRLLPLALAVGLVAAAPAAAADAVDARDSGPDTIDVSRYPEPQKRNYELFLQRCSKCHTTARAVNAHYNAREWRRYLKRMVRRPGANISEEETDQIYDFLKYFSERQGF